MSLLPFLLFILFCAFIVGMICALFWLVSYFGRSNAEDLRSERCPQCGTKRKPRKTGVVRNLVEFELACPVCDYTSWDIPPKTNLSNPASDQSINRFPFNP